MCGTAMKRQITEFIVMRVGQLSGVDILESDDLFIDGLLDSLSFAELVSAIEDKFLVVLDFTKVDNWENIRTPLGLTEFCKENT